MYNIRTLYQQSKLDKYKNMSAGSLSILIDGILDDQSRKNSSREMGKVTSVDYKVSQIYSKLKLKDNDFIPATNPVITVENKADVKYQSIHCTKLSNHNLYHPLTENNVCDVPSSIEEIPLQEKDCSAIMSEFEEFREYTYRSKELKNFLLSPVEKGRTLICNLISLHNKFDLIKQISKEEKNKGASGLNDCDTLYLLEYYIKKLKNRLYLMEVNSTSKPLLFAKKTSPSGYHFQFSTTITEFIVEEIKSKLNDTKDNRILEIIEAYQSSYKKKAIIRDNFFSEHCTPKSEMRKKNKPASQVDLNLVSTEDLNKSTFQAKPEKMTIIKFISQKVGPLLEKSIPKIFKSKRINGSEEKAFNNYYKSAIVPKKEDKLFREEVKIESGIVLIGQLEMSKIRSYSIRNAENDKLFTVNYTSTHKNKKNSMTIKMHLRADENLNSEFDYKKSNDYSSRVFKNLESLNNYEAIQYVTFNLF